MNLTESGLEDARRIRDHLHRIADVVVADLFAGHHCKNAADVAAIMELPKQAAEEPALLNFAYTIYQALYEATKTAVVAHYQSAQALNRPGSLE